MERKISMIIGMRGCGKSYFADAMLRDEKRVFVYDVQNEYTNGVVFENIAALCKFWKHIGDGDFRIIYRPLNAEAEFGKICELVWLCQNVCFMVEEVHTFCRPNQLADSFRKILTRGRRFCISVIGVTQRPRGIDHTLTAMTKTAYIFQTREPDDRVYLRQWLGDGIEAKLDELKQFEHVVWHDEKPGEFTIQKA